MPRKVVDKLLRSTHQKSAQQNSDFDNIKENARTKRDSCTPRMCQPRRSGCGDLYLSSFTEALGQTAYAAGALSIAMWLGASTIVEAGVPAPTLVRVQNYVGVAALFQLAAFLVFATIDQCRVED